MIRKRPKIRNIADLKRYKYHLQRQLRIRGKILDIRLRRFEDKLTVPNITRELFRGSKLEWAMPVAASYLNYKVKSGKNLLGIVGGFLAGFGSIFSFIKRSKKASPQSQGYNSQRQDNGDGDVQMFI